MTIVEGEKEFMASGHLLVDEMKLKSDMYWNVSSEEVHKFVWLSSKRDL
jgi:hypothetical protein